MSATLTVTEHVVHGQRAIVGVSRRLGERYEWVATIDTLTGKGDEYYTVLDTVDGGYTVTKFGSDTGYRVHLWDNGAVCDCPDHRYRRRRCRHVELAEAVKRRW